MQIYKNGIVEVNSTPTINLYTKQWITSGYIKLEYNYSTDIFKDYGFSTCLKLSPNPSIAVADK